MLRAMITGATGFIGSHLTETLALRKWEVTCLVRPQSQTDFIQKFSVRILRGPLDGREVLERAVEGQDYIFHLAARIRSAPREVYEKSNHKLTRDLVSACLSRNPNVKRFVYISSIAAAGPSPLDQHADETLAPCPVSEYGQTKLEGEKAVQEVWNKIPATIIRPPNVYGPRQLETDLLIKLIQKRVVPILRSMEKSTSLIYIDDLIQGILQAVESPNTQGQIYYLTDGAGYSWREIILTIKRNVLGEALFLPLPEEIISFFALLSDILKAAGMKRLFFGQRAWQAMVQTHWLFSSSKATRDFGFTPCYNLDEGIKDMIRLRLEKLGKL